MHICCISWCLDVWTIPSRCTRYHCLKRCHEVAVSWRSFIAEFGSWEKHGKPILQETMFIINWFTVHLMLNIMFAATFPSNQFIDPLSTASGWVFKVANLQGTCAAPWAAKEVMGPPANVCLNLVSISFCGAMFDDQKSLFKHPMPGRS